MSKPEMTPSGSLESPPRGPSASPVCAACGAAGARWRAEWETALCVYCAALAATAPVASCVAAGCEARALRDGLHCAAHTAAPLDALPLFAPEAP